MIWKPKVGDRVMVYAKSYPVIPGTIVDILKKPDKYNGDLVNHVVFDAPVDQYFTQEYFADEELQYLGGANGKT